MSQHNGRKLFATRYHGLAALAALVVIAAGAVTAGSWMLLRDPDPATASRQTLLRWLVLSDIARQPRARQLALVDRLETELQAGFDVSQADQLSDQRRTLLQENITTLKRLWFVERVEQYSALSAAEKSAFMDERVNTVLAWTAMEDALQAGGDGGLAAAAFFDEIQAWVDAEEDPARRARMTAAVQDGVVRWLSTHPLDDQPPGVRAELALRIAAQLDAGLRLSSLSSSQPSEEKRRLKQNAELLFQAWLLEQSRLYFDLPESERAAFVDRRIDNVTDWGVLNLLAEEQSDNTQAQGAARLLALTQAWIAAAPEEDQPKLQALTTAVQARMFLRMLQSSFGRGARGR